MKTLQTAFKKERKSINRILSRGNLLSLKFSDDGTAIEVQSLFHAWIITENARGNFTLFHQNYGGHSRSEQGYHKQCNAFSLTSALTVIEQHDQYWLQAPEKESLYGVPRKSRRCRKIKQRNAYNQAEHVLKLIESERRKRFFADAACPA